MTLPECPEEVLPDCPEPVGLRYQRLRAPANNGESLVAPAFACVGRMLATNEASLTAADAKVFGRPLVELADDARREVLNAAIKYTASYRDVPQEWRDTPPNRVIAAGHQPELFHPGVWFKNFALADLAQIHQAVAMNLVIDTDDAKAAAINVPGGSVERPIVRPVPYDDPAEATVPFEERSIRNQELFASFAHRACEHLRPLVTEEPLIRRVWPLAVARAQETGKLGAALAQARHMLEGELGLTSLELPQSQVCESNSFRWFVAHLLCEAERFVEAHNGALAAYRKINRVRSQAHPVPDLEVADGWVETPFWVWCGQRPVRRSLYVKCSAGGVVLTDRHQFEARIPSSCGSDANAERVIQALADLSARGMKLRTKALATTMWARLALSDLFLHGIGGAKYDQLNDEIIRRFFGVTPPGFMTVSATMRLPIAGELEQQSDTESIRALERQLRELEFQPERHIGKEISTDPAAAQLLQEKLALTQRSVSRGTESKQRFHRFRQINAQLHQFVADKRNRLEQLLLDLRPAVRATEMLRSREYAFCLFPLDNIQRLLLAIRPNEP